MKNKNSGEKCEFWQKSEQFSHTSLSLLNKNFLFFVCSAIVSLFFKINFSQSSSDIAVTIQINRFFFFSRQTTK